VYTADRRDEVQFLEWVGRVVGSVLNRNEEQQQKLVTTKQQQELEDIIEFENTLKERIQELNLELKDSNELRESDTIINETDTLESVLGRLPDFKHGDIARAIEIAEANKNFRQAKQLREELCDIHDMESGITANMKKRNRH
jgi:hypothetical protein